MVKLKTNLKTALVVGTCLSGIMPGFALAQGKTVDLRAPVSLTNDNGSGETLNSTRPSVFLLSDTFALIEATAEPALGSEQTAGASFDFNKRADFSSNVVSSGMSSTTGLIEGNRSGAAALTFPVGRNLPTGGQVVFGGVEFDTSSPNTLAIVQSSDKAITSWATFDIGAGYNVAIRQPNANSAMLARVRGDMPSLIEGQLTANGRVVLVNPNGIAVGAGGRIDTGSFVASTLDIADADFLKGNLTFRRTGKAATVVNQGAINAASSVALVGSGVVNEGVVSARLGRIGYGAGDMLTVDFTGDQFLSIAVPVSQAAGITDALGRPLEALVHANGTTSAQGGQIYLSARAARELMLGAVKVDGDLVATTVREGANNRISLGSVKIDGGDGLVQIEGKIDASGGANLNGGSISISGGAVGLGGVINASGDRNGGSVDVTAAKVLSLAGAVGALGLRGNGGTLTFTSAGSITENVNGSNDASGALSGGAISVTAGGDLATSGTYRANGLLGLGGRIDMTGSSVRLLSTSLSAQGLQQGGLIRIGGAFQGGTPTRTGYKDYHAFEGRFGALPTLSNAQTTFVNDGVSINVSSSRGQGGSAIIWSDQTTTMLGSLSARGLRTGGMAEVSGKETLRYVDLDRIDTGIGGTLLLDPKDIVIGDFAAASTWQYAGLIGQGAVPPGIHVSDLNPLDRFGASVALNAAGDRLAVGQPGDRGFENDSSSNGSVRLFTFTDTSFGGGRLIGTIGGGYVGAGNIDTSAFLAGNGGFGSSVALNAAGDRLAVGSPNEQLTPFALQATGVQFINSLRYGTVRLFTFANNSFGGGRLAGTIGAGFRGVGDLDLANSLRGEYLFGSSVALNAAGDRLAVGATGDDGLTNAARASGTVRLFTFANTDFGGVALAGTIGRGHTGAGNVDLGPALGEADSFGSAVALNAAGDRLAVGASGDDGFGNLVVNSGSVRLFTFANNSFAGGTLVSQIGRGYTGAGNLDLAPALEVGDAFGSALALNAAGDRLAVGVFGDDGFGNLVTDSGAVRLFTFANNSFAGGALVGTMGRGYTGVGDIDIGAALNNAQRFGSSVALNAVGNRLAVGSEFGSSFGNSILNVGSVRLYTFANNSFGGGALASSIGVNFGLPGAVPNYLDLTPALGADSFSAQSVALNGAGDRLAIGASGDSAFGGGPGGIGTVRLFRFADTNFSGGVLVGTIGRGYTGAGNIDLGTALEVGDGFGSSVALNAAGDRLAVGANGDDGFGNVATNSGAVRLFNFANNSFGGGVLAGTIGRGYAGLGDMDLGTALEAGDLFGGAVALNAAGDRLAVGAIGDDGFANVKPDSGSVRLFTFANTSFGGGSLAGNIGRGYIGVGDVNVIRLDRGYEFGRSVALNAIGDRLAVGSKGAFAVFSDDPAIAVRPQDANVRLFTFANTTFGGGALAAIIGNTFDTAMDDISIPLRRSSGQRSFGTSVALNAAGDRLAVGDPGITNNQPFNDSNGGIFLVRFLNNSFGGGENFGIIGADSIGLSDFNTSISSIGAGVRIGASVALDASGTRLAVGSSERGQPVWLLRQSTNSGVQFGDNPGGTSNVSVSALARFLTSGQSINLQASNDITLASALTYRNLGNLTLTAGRSILLNANIVTGNGVLTLNANNGAADLSTVNANRSAGAAEITMAAGTSINAGAGTVTINLGNGAGLTTPTSGDITLRNISAGTIKVTNAGTTAGSDIIIAAGSTLTASGLNYAIDLRALNGTFTNLAGPSAFNLTYFGGFGRYRIYSDAPDTTIEGVSGYVKRYNVANEAEFESLFRFANPAGPNLIAYRIAPILTVAAANNTRIYGNGNPALSSSITGFIDGDTAAGSLTGAANVSTKAGSTSAVGNYAITSALGTLASAEGYRFAFTNGTLAITPRPISVTANALSRVFGDANPTLTYAVGGQGLVNGDTLSGTLATTAATTSNVGTYAITQGTLAGGNNYEIAYTGANLLVLARNLSITANALSRTYGDANPALTYVVGGQGLVNGDTLTGALATSATTTSNVGNYAITQGTLAASSNYSVAYSGANLSVLARSLTITANALSRTYGDANPALTYVVGGQGLRNGDTLTGALVTTATTASNVGTYAITQGTLAASSNYNVAYSAANLSVLARSLSITANALTRVYGDGNPALTYVVGGQGLVSGDTLTGLLATTANTASNVGSYAITQGTLAANSNYTLVYNGANLEITRRKIGVQADSLSRGFGFPDPSLTFTFFSGSLVHGDALSGALQRTPGEMVGQYAINQGSLNNGNYEISYRPGVFTIDPTISTLPLGNQSIDDTLPSGFITASTISTEIETSDVAWPAVNDNNNPPPTKAGCVQSDRGVCVVAGS